MYSVLLFYCTISSFNIIKNKLSQSEEENSEEGNNGGVSEEFDDSLGKFLTIGKRTNGVFMEGGKVRLFNDLRHDIISQNTANIKDFCDNGL